MTVLTIKCSGLYHLCRCHGEREITEMESNEGWNWRELARSWAPPLTSFVTWARWLALLDPPFTRPENWGNNSTHKVVVRVDGDTSAHGV